MRKLTLLFILLIISCTAFCADGDTSQKDLVEFLLSSEFIGSVITLAVILIGQFVPTEKANPIIRILTGILTLFTPDRRKGGGVHKLSESRSGGDTLSNDNEADIPVVTPRPPGTHRDKK